MGWEWLYAVSHSSRCAGWIFPPLSHNCEYLWLAGLTVLIPLRAGVHAISVSEAATLLTIFLPHGSRQEHDNTCPSEHAPLTLSSPASLDMGSFLPRRRGTSPAYGDTGSLDPTPLNVLVASQLLRSSLLEYSLLSTNVLVVACLSVRHRSRFQWTPL